jgi:hypothetical protein
LTTSASMSLPGLSLWSPAIRGLSGPSAVYHPPETSAGDHDLDRKDLPPPASPLRTGISDADRARATLPEPVPNSLRLILHGVTNPRGRSPSQQEPGQSQRIGRDQLIVSAPSPPHHHRRRVRQVLSVYGEQSSARLATHGLQAKVLTAFAGTSRFNPKTPPILPSACRCPCQPPTRLPGSRN